MEDARSKYPSLPPNYVSILQLQERWTKEQQQMPEEKERQRDRESHSPTGEKDTTQDDTRPKFKGGRKFRQIGGKHSPSTDERSQKAKWLDQDRAKIEPKTRKLTAAKVKVDTRTGLVESRNPEKVKVGGQKLESLKVRKKDGRTVEDCCQKSEMENVVVVGEEIKDDEQKTAGNKKKENRRRNPRAEEELAGGSILSASKNGNGENFPGRVNQMDGIHHRMEKLSVDPGKLGGSHGSTASRRDGYRWKPGVPGRFASQKASGSGLVWVRKGEASDGNVASTSCSGASDRQR